MSTTTAPPAEHDVVELLREAQGRPAGSKGTVVLFCGDELGLDMTGPDYDEDDTRSEIAFAKRHEVRVTWRAPIRDA